MTLRGDAGFKYGAGPTTYAMEWPLRFLQPGETKSRYDSWSIDYEEREVLVVGSGAAEIRAVIALENTPEDLLAMLAAGADGTSLVYWPSLAGGTSYACELVEPKGDTIALIRDRMLPMKGRYEVTIRLRRTDGGNFDALL